MTEKDPRDVIATIRRSIEVSPRGARKLRFHRLRDLFGFQAWSTPRKDLIARLIQDAGIHAEPAVHDASPDAWVLLTLPELPPDVDRHPEPRPSAEWFAHLQSVHMDSEREVEMHFVSPLFRALGYTEEQEAAGFRFDLWEGVHHRLVEADIIYFADPTHSLDHGEPLVLVECKSPAMAFDAGTGQARSYAYWVKPAFYVTTNGTALIVHNYQGGAIPDLKVMDMTRSELKERFDELYNVLSYDAAVDARRAKIAKYSNQPGHNQSGN